MPLDPVSVALLDAVRAMGFELAGGTVEDVRERSRQAMGLVADVVELAAVEDRTVPGPAGPIPVRIYRPSLEGDRPTVVFFHGGGWVIGDLESHDDVCRRLARDADVVVMAVDYRLAPEHRYPAAADDCYAAAVWADANRALLGGARGKLAVAGDSAGGNLSAVVAQMARDRNGPTISFQLLIYPVTGGPWETWPSYTENGEGYLLDRTAMEWFTGHYLGEGNRCADPYFSPATAETLADLPPAHVITAEYDPLRDEGEAYAAALTAAGVPATNTRYAGVLHGFYGMATLLQQARDAQLEAATRLREGLE